MVIATQIEKNYRYKRTYLHNLAMAIGAIAVIYFIVMLYITMNLAGTFIPSVHLLIIAMIVIMVFIVAISIKPPVYVKISEGELKVRQMYIGSWKKLMLSELKSVRNKGEIIYLVSGNNNHREVQIKPELMHANDAEELQDLLEDIIANKPLK